MGVCSHYPPEPFAAQWVPVSPRERPPMGLPAAPRMGELPTAFVTLPADFSPTAARFDAPRVYFVRTSVHFLPASADFATP